MDLLKQWMTSFVGSVFLISCAPKASFQNALPPPTGILDGTTVTQRTTEASKSVVYLEFLDENGKRVSYCTGALIGTRTVLTAAHCFDYEVNPKRRSFNIVFANKVSDEATRVHRNGLAHTVHPYYNSMSSKPKLYDHDAAVVVFEGDVPTGYEMAVVDTDVHANYAGEDVAAYGYGRVKDYLGNPNDKVNGGSGVLRRGVLRVNDDYNQAPDRYFISSASPAFLCQGDSGGPEFYSKGGLVKLVGVNSASMGGYLKNGTIHCRGGSQATKVAPLSAWILSTQKDLLSRY